MMPDEDLDILAWLYGPGRQFQETKAWLEAFAVQLLRLGIPIDRVTTGIPILHPSVVSSSMLWQKGEETVERLFQHNPDTVQDFLDSPIFKIYNGHGPIRCPIDPDQAADDPYPILSTLRDAGLRDYLALPITFADGSQKVMTFATKRASGFSDSDVAQLSDAMTPAAMILENQVLRRTAITLLDTYVGAKAGAAVLQGAISRGTGETIHAVIWFCDLRGFTELSNSLDMRPLIDLLNLYFGTVTDAVEAEGGEVLKFIGDALLAIFPFDDAADAKQATAAALRSARKALAGLQQANQQADKKERLNTGIALHVGEVIFGNIGGAQRLDFTVIGPAVNLASRIEGLCGRLEQPLLVSADFTAVADGAFQSLGKFALKGMPQPAEIFLPAPPD